MTILKLQHAIALCKQDTFSRNTEKIIYKVIDASCTENTRSNFFSVHSENFDISNGLGWKIRCIAWSDSCDWLFFLLGPEYFFQNPELRAETEAKFLKDLEQFEKYRHVKNGSTETCSNYISSQHTHSWTISSHHSDERTYSNPGVGSPVMGQRHFCMGPNISYSRLSKICITMVDAATKGWRLSVKKE